MSRFLQLLSSAPPFLLRSLEGWRRSLAFLAASDGGDRPKKCFIFFALLSVNIQRSTFPS